MCLGGECFRPGGVRYSIIKERQTRKEDREVRREHGTKAFSLLAPHSSPLAPGGKVRPPESDASIVYTYILTRSQVEIWIFLKNFGLKGGVAWAVILLLALAAGWLYEPLASRRPWLANLNN